MVRHMHRLDSLRAAGIGVEARQGAVFACGKMFLFGIEAYLDPAPHVRAAVVEVEVCGRNRTNGGRGGSEHGLGSACENTSSMMSARAKLTHLCMPFAATYPTRGFSAGGCPDNECKHRVQQEQEIVACAECCNPLSDLHEPLVVADTLMHRDLISLGLVDALVVLARDRAVRTQLGLVGSHIAQKQRYPAPPAAILARHLTKGARLFVRRPRRCRDVVRGAAVSGPDARNGGDGAVHAALFMEFHLLARAQQLGATGVGAFFAWWWSSLRLFFFFFFFAVVFLTAAAGGGRRGGMRWTRRGGGRRFHFLLFLEGHRAADSSSLDHRVVGMVGRVVSPDAIAADPATPPPISTRQFVRV